MEENESRLRSYSCYVDTSVATTSDEPLSSMQKCLNLYTAQRGGGGFAANPPTHARTDPYHCFVLCFLAELAAVHNQMLEGQRPRSLLSPDTHLPF